MDLINTHYNMYLSDQIIIYDTFGVLFMRSFLPLLYASRVISVIFLWPKVESRNEDDG